MDYFRCIQDHRISAPQYAAFMQEHYLDLRRHVKEDTIPEDAVYDLDQIEGKFRSDPGIGCAFSSRYGIRVDTSSPMGDGSKALYGDGAKLVPRAKRRFFFVDGGNVIVRPQLYMDWFRIHPRYLTKGDGSYGFCIVWESRAGKILYDRGVKWADMYRGIEYATIDELDAIEESRGERVSTLWYDSRVWNLFYGRDLQLYPPTPFIPVLRYLREYLRHLVSHPRDKRLTFAQPS